jgi:hypothetical protein
MLNNAVHLVVCVLGVVGVSVSCLLDVRSGAVQVPFGGWCATLHADFRGRLVAAGSCSLSTVLLLGEIRQSAWPEFQYKVSHIGVLFIP